MKLGNFALSLAVKDIALSRAFYEKLGFEEVGGDQNQGWLVMKSGTTKIGLFQGMFEHNIMTFNPGWDSEGAALADFDDVRAIQKSLREAGVEFDVEADESTTGPAHFMLKDPDGNVIMFDQHV